MPLYDFKCPDGHTHEKLFRRSVHVEDERPCPCGKTAKRMTWGRLNVIGPVFEKLEEHSLAVLGEKGMRETGGGFRSWRELEKYEEAQGVYRPSDTELKNNLVTAKHEAAQIEEAYADSREKGDAKTLELQVKDSTGWDDEQYRSWKTAQEDVKDLKPTTPGESHAG